MINDIPEHVQIEPGPQHRYEIIIRDIENEKVIYRNINFAGVFCGMEKVIAFGPEPEGQHQVFAFGNPILQFYSVDQLQKWFNTEGMPKTMAELKRRGFIQTNIEDFNEFFKKQRPD